MSSVMIPALAAAVAAAPRVECALKMLVSIPALSKTVLSHLATVDGATGLFGIMTLKNSLDWASLRQNSFVSSRTPLACALGTHNVSCLERQGRKLLLLVCPA